MNPLEKLLQQRANLDAEITRLMELPVKENRDATPEEVKAIADADDKLIALDDAIKRAERRAAQAEQEPESRGVRSAPPGEAPAVHTKPDRPFSILRAIRIEAGLESGGLEAECHQEMLKRARAANRMVRGILMPIGDDPETRRMMGRAERRDATTTTIAGSIYTRPDGFIDLLRSNTVTDRLGVTYLTGLKGLFAMTRQNSTNTFQWVAEGIAATPTNLGFDRVSFSPKFAVASQVITREALMQTSVDMDRITEDDFAKIHALGVDAAIINGPGGAAPLGLANNPAIPTYNVLADAGNGGPFTYADAVNMETGVAQANALRGRMAYLTNPRMRGSLKQQFVGTAGYPLFIYTKGGQPDVGEINGYDSYVTTLVPANLTKGTATNCSMIVYGMFADCIAAIYDTGGLDLVVDPYSLKRSGSIEMTTYLAMDTNVRHPESFKLCTDAIPQY